MAPPAAARLWAAGNGRVAGAALLALLGAGCGESPAPVPPAMPYADPGFVEAENFRLRYAVTLTNDLPAEIAGSYGIVPRRNLALVAITLERRDAADGSRVDADALSAEAVALTGERKALALARHDDPGGPTWLAPLEVRHRVPVTIEIQARATATSPEIHARLTREFRLE
jgi:hypothetical protein